MSFRFLNESKTYIEEMLYLFNLIIYTNLQKVQD